MPVQPPPMVPPQKSSSHPALFIAGTTLLAIAISYLGYQNWQLKQQVNRLDKLVQVDNTPLSSPTDSSDPTASQAPNGDLANWKIYTNGILGFQFSNPQEINFIYDQFKEYTENKSSSGNLLLQNFDGLKPR